METVLFNPAISSDISNLGYMEYAQIPVFPIYPEPPFNLSTQVYTPVPSLLEVVPVPDYVSLISPFPGAYLKTDGQIFDGIPGYDAIAFSNANGDVSQLTPTSFFDADANTGYAGFTNYTIDFDNIDLENLSLADLANINDLLSLVPVNPDFPALDSNAGVTIAFELALFGETSAPNRAGFSVVAVSSDPSKEIELGFKLAGPDRIYALSENLVEAENSSAVPIDLSRYQTYWLSMSGDQYSLSINGVQVLTGNLRDYNFDPSASDPPLPDSANPYETPNFLFLGDNTDQANSEFSLGKVSVLSLQTSLTTDLLDDYIATHPDLIQAFGYNLEAGRQHYIANGFEEGRQVDGFAEDIYLASNGDLIGIFGYNLEAATQHYIQSGFAEGRATERFFPEIYLDSYADLQQAFGDDLAAATRHFIEFGFAEGRDPLAGFNGAAYIASYDDLIAALGNNAAAGRQHFVQFGYEEGRQITFEADDYIASHGDLIQVLGYTLAAGIDHFITFGADEGRARDTFDEVAYLNKYADLQAAFGDDLTAVTRHFIEFGFAEGRTV